MQLVQSWSSSKHLQRGTGPGRGQQWESCTKEAANTPTPPCSPCRQECGAAPQLCSSLQLPGSTHPAPSLWPHGPFPLTTALGSGTCVVAADAHSHALGMENIATGIQAGQTGSSQWVHDRSCLCFLRHPSPEFPYRSLCDGDEWDWESGCREGMCSVVIPKSFQTTNCLLESHWT